MASTGKPDEKAQVAPPRRKEWPEYKPGSSPILPSATAKRDANTACVRGAGDADLVLYTNAGPDSSAGIKRSIVRYALTGQSGEFGIGSNGIMRKRSPACMVLDQRINTFKPRGVRVTSERHKCFCGSNLAREGTMIFDLRAHKKNANRKEVHRVRSS